MISRKITGMARETTMLRKKIMTLLILLSVSLLGPLALAGDDAYDVMGNAHDISQAKDQWLIINYWADWCHACVAEIPTLNKLAALIKDKAVFMFGVNYDSLSDVAQQKFAEQYQINYLLLRNNPFNNRMPHIQITSLPVTYIISPSGQLKVLHGEIQINDVLAIIGK